MYNVNWNYDTKWC